MRVARKEGHESGDYNSWQDGYIRFTLRYHASHRQGLAKEISSIGLWEPRPYCTFFLRTHYKAFHFLYNFHSLYRDSTLCTTQEMLSVLIQPLAVMFLRFAQSYTHPGCSDSTLHSLPYFRHKLQYNTSHSFTSHAGFFASVPLTSLNFSRLLSNNPHFQQLLLLSLPMFPLVDYNIL